MFSGAHLVIFSADAEADRKVLRDVLGVEGVDAGGGWMILPLPKSEVAVHPAETGGNVEIYLITDDITATREALGARAYTCAPISDEGWGLMSSFQLPGGTKIGFYEPRHPTAI